MSVNSLPKIVIRQRRGCDLNPGPSAPESSTLTTRLPSHSNFTARDPKWTDVNIRQVDSVARRVYYSFLFSFVVLSFFSCIVGYRITE